MIWSPSICLLASVCYGEGSNKVFDQIFNQVALLLVKTLLLLIFKSLSTLFNKCSMTIFADNE